MEDWIVRLAQSIKESENFNAFCDQTWKYIQKPNTNSKRKINTLLEELEKNIKEALGKLSEENLPAGDETPRDLLEIMLITFFLMCVLYERKKMYADLLVRFYMLCQYFNLAYAELPEESKDHHENKKQDEYLFSCTYMNGDILQDYTCDMRQNAYDPICYLSSDYVRQIMDKCVKEIDVDDVKDSVEDSVAMSIGCYITCIAYMNGIVTGNGMKKMCAAYTLYTEN